MLKFNLTDIDELLEKVRNAHAQSYLNEAIISYRSGAYRSSIIATWIAVCIDIIEKIRELSTEGDKIAVVIIEKLMSIDDRDTINMLKFEKNILNYACNDLQFISPIEKIHLERLREDRHISAHPTFSKDGIQFNPSPELARTYIVLSCNYLLIHGPTMGKAILERIIDFIKESSFPSDNEGAFTILSSETWLGRAKESTIRNLLLILLKRIFSDSKKIKQDHFFKITATIGAIKRISPSVYNDIITKKFNSILETSFDNNFYRIFVLLYKNHDLWRYVDSPTKTRIVSIFKSIDVDDIISYKLIYVISQFSELQQHFLIRFTSLNYEDKYKILSSCPSFILKEYAISLFLESDTFIESYEHGINVLIPHSIYFNDDNLQYLLTNIIESKRHKINQILHAGNIDEVFSSLYTNTLDTVSSHSSTWNEFWRKIFDKKLYNNFPLLLEKLCDDNVIDINLIPTPQIIELDDAPF